MAGPPPGHILGHAGLSDFDAELEKLAMNSWRSPEWIGDTHLADQLADFQYLHRTGRVLQYVSRFRTDSAGAYAVRERLVDSFAITIERRCGGAAVPVL